MRDRGMVALVWVWDIGLNFLDWNNLAFLRKGLSTFLGIFILLSYLLGEASFSLFLFLRTTLTKEKQRMHTYSLSWSLRAVMLDKL